MADELRGGHVCSPVSDEKTLRNSTQAEAEGGKTKELTVVNETACSLNRVLCNAV